MRRLAALAMFVGALVPIAPEARAHDHRPPKPARLRAGEEVQDGRKIHSYWVRRRRDGNCFITDTFDFTTFPRAIGYEAGTPVAVTLFKPAMPVEWVVQAWRDVDEDGHPRGAPDPVPAVPQPVRRDGETVAWRLELAPPLVDGHMYLQVEAYWTDEEECAPQPDLGTQTATWTFHLRAG